MIDALLLPASLTLAVFTVVPLLRSERWWIRIFDFPRLQIAMASAAVLLALATRPADGWAFWVAVVLASATVLTQLGYVLPYTPLWRKETKDAEGGHPTLTLLMANVLMHNRRSEPLLRFIQQRRPDLVVLDEPDAWWEGALRALERDYPHTVKEPLPNTYGMLLYSRLPFLQLERQHLVEPDVPSFHVGSRWTGERCGCTSSTRGHRPRARRKAPRTGTSSSWSSDGWPRASGIPRLLPAT
jgi:endonuclease/exonuclease/phosphatase (EEP) superfamily protein YafD